MSDSDDVKPLLIDDVHETARETHENFRSHTVVDYLCDLRIVLDVPRCGFHFREEPVAQPGTSKFYPFGSEVQAAQLSLDLVRRSVARLLEKHLGH